MNINRDLNDLEGMDFRHLPVMADQVIKALDIKEKGFYVDCTAGGGGHTKRILSCLGPKGQILALDRDNDAFRHLEKKFESDNRVSVMCKSFFKLEEIFEKLGFSSADGFLFDLGVSSYQLDSAHRGFSFLKKGPLDMRMDQENGITAADIVNTWPEKRIAELFRVNGEERHAKFIARRIAERREEKEFTDTLDLAQFIESRMPGKRPDQRIHPATRCFQALRIEVNQELSCLESSIRQAVGLLKTGGRIGVITFHSLEDRIVKRTFRDLTGVCKCPPELPICVCKCSQTVKLLNRKALKPDQAETALNPRSRSAKFRGAIKV